MKIVTTLCAALLAAPFLRAQEGGAVPQMPDPKTEAHAPLARLAGTWTTACRMEAMPGVPGMAEPTTWTGTERAELVCNGLWLKCVSESKCHDQQMQGLWLTGYDPGQKKYRGLWVSSMDEPYMECDGSYDADTRTWTYTGTSPQGGFRSVLAVESDDRTVETCYLVGEDGTQTQCMRIERTRKADAGPVDASASMPKPAGEHRAPLADCVGDWNVVTSFSMPGQGAIEEQASERVRPICGGKWLWSDFAGTMMGQPFEGHSLFGYDPVKQQYANVWIDSGSATHALTWGSYDPARKQWTFDGECIDPAGRNARIHQVYRQPDADTRELQMTMTTADGTETMAIHYTRKPK